ncbi:hypothetical protein [Chryseobacterium sp. IHB B 17019]|uniref:hypothetical protein n=1 Tax=Chryseobacterium sp. IHB B 17019 TaxID=1721091 RepID=UPI0012370A06|nr:hypothetical protein [Chryseobacterium sp. IHB B 17019]
MRLIIEMRLRLLRRFAPRNDKQKLISCIKHSMKTTETSVVTEAPEATIPTIIAPIAAFV